MVDHFALLVTQCLQGIYLRGLAGWQPAPAPVHQRKLGGADRRSGQKVACACDLRADFRDGQIAVQFPHDLTHGGCEPSRFARSAQGKIHLANRFSLLLPRCIEQRRDLLALGSVFGVSPHADDLDFMSFARSDALTEHVFAVFAGEELARKSLIYDGDLGRTLVILRA